MTGKILGVGYHKPLIKWLKEEAKYIVEKKNGLRIAKDYKVNNLKWK